jgi:hypothetical protein
MRLARGGFRRYYQRGCGAAAKLLLWRAQISAELWARRALL